MQHFCFETLSLLPSQVLRHFRWMYLIEPVHLHGAINGSVLFPGSRQTLQLISFAVTIDWISFKFEFGMIAFDPPNYFFIDPIFSLISKLYWYFKSSYTSFKTLIYFKSITAEWLCINAGTNSFILIVCFPNFMISLSEIAYVFNFIRRYLLR